jgi:hypothetical protein
LLAELVGGFERLIAQVSVVGKREGEFAVHEVVGRNSGVVEPLEEVAKGEEALIEGTRYFRVGESGFGCQFTVRL